MSYSSQQLSTSASFQLLRPVRLFGLALVFLLGSSIAHADTFQITFTGDSAWGISVTGTGSFTTDGVCVVCSPGSGLLSFNADVSPFDTGIEVFDLADDSASLKYNRSTQLFSTSGSIFNSENSDLLDLFATAGNGEFSLTFPAPQSHNTPPINFFDGTTGHGGTYAIAQVTAVPEASSVFLLVTVVMLGILSRRKLLARPDPSAQR